MASYRLVAADDFEKYGVSHLAVVLILVAGCILLAYLGRSHRGTPEAERFSRRFAVLVAALLPLQLAQLLPDRFTLSGSLPLQLCDLAWFASIYALWTRRPWAVALTYYWGLTLSSQAVLTPDLGRDFPELTFLTFWALHLIVVWTPVYLTWGLGIRPTWRRYRSTVAITAGWAVTVFCLNLVLNTNYGYLNRKPERGSILDLFGPWPYYVLVEVVIVVLAWALITWPWETKGAKRRSSPPAAHVARGSDHD